MSIFDVSWGHLPGIPTASWWDRRLRRLPLEVFHDLTVRQGIVEDLGAPKNSMVDKSALKCPDDAKTP